MNAWGVLIVGVGFLLLYMGIKNKNVSDLPKLFAPQGSPNATTSVPTTTR